MKDFKKKKHLKFLSNEGFDLSDESTQAVVLKNAGLINGFTTSDLYSLIESQKQVLGTGETLKAPKEIVMFVKKPYSVLLFNSVDESEKFVSGFDGFTAHHDSHMTEKESSEARRVFYCFFVLNLDPWLASRCDYSSESICNGAETPPGMEVIHDYITEQSELSLMDFVLNFRSPNSDSELVNSDSLKHRRVLHFGYNFNYNTNGVDERFSGDQVLPIPDICYDLFLNSLLDSGRIPQMPDQLTVNVYQPGQGIPSHVDTHSVFTEQLLSLSLGSPCIMEMKLNLSGENDCAKEKKIPVLLPRRSLAIMEQQASLDYPMLCDSQKRIQHLSEPKSDQDNNRTYLPRSTDDAATLEAKYVKEVYDQIAISFSGTRHSPWPKVKQFLDEIPSGSIVLDLGCGNGKYLYGHSQLFKVGLDNSSGLIDICSERGFQVMTTDCLNTPLRNNCCDYIISIAVIHHLSTLERRKEVISEFLRLLRPGGKALIYVWAMEQNMNNEKSNYISSKKGQIEDLFTPKTVLESKQKELDATENSESEVIEYHVNRTPFQQQDLFVPFAKRDQKAKCNGQSKQTDETFYRFYHLFRKNELEKLCLSSKCDGNKVEIVHSYYDDGNWCVIIQKI
ncbi:tRNA (carboxymethyluridine(34)-5-O)-methyltransferase ALKBH8-like isoform X2 [Convolutriloba macropyga]|uniref:tRNA (carboxymethyluridine(34)-5-O)-methyltransferase ALKBH8-like isoform X2 n=1 Tax=Convolutriloba macropyga TaxID=536237 RepID=UPI003F525CC7